MGTSPICYFFLQLENPCLYSEYIQYTPVPIKKSPPLETPKESVSTLISDEDDDEIDLTNDKLPVQSSSQGKDKGPITPESSPTSSSSNISRSRSSLSRTPSQTLDASIYLERLRSTYHRTSSTSSSRSSPPREESTGEYLRRKGLGDQYDSEFLEEFVGRSTPRNFSLATNSKDIAAFENRLKQSGRHLVFFSLFFPLPFPFFPFLFAFLPFPLFPFSFSHLPF